MNARLQVLAVIPVNQPASSSPRTSATPSGRRTPTTPRASAVTSFVAVRRGLRLGGERAVDGGSGAGLPFLPASFTSAFHRSEGGSSSTAASSRARPVRVVALHPAFDLRQRAPHERVRAGQTRRSRNRPRAADVGELGPARRCPPPIGRCRSAPTPRRATAPPRSPRAGGGLGGAGRSTRSRWPRTPRATQAARAGQPEHRHVAGYVAARLRLRAPAVPGIGVRQQVRGAMPPAQTEPARLPIFVEHGEPPVLRGRRDELDGELDLVLSVGRTCAAAKATQRRRSPMPSGCCNSFSDAGAGRADPQRIGQPREQVAPGFRG